MQARYQATLQPEPVNGHKDPRTTARQVLSQEWGSMNLRFEMAAGRFSRRRCPPRMSSLRRSSPRDFLWPIAVAALEVLASSRSQVAAPHLANFDKVAHFFWYGLLATLICRLGRGWRGAVIALLAASAFGATDEWHQSFVPGRTCELGDWIADTLGAALAASSYQGWGTYRRYLESPLRRLAGLEDGDAGLKIAADERSTG